MSQDRSVRHVTLYDVVAERVDYQGFIDRRGRSMSGSERSVESDRDDDSAVGGNRAGLPVRPDEALFRQANAPVRYEENDIYAADRHLTSDQELPDSDLLKAIHAYASDFYGRATLNGGASDFRSMDETALIACGVLLEEACSEILGSTGDLVFTEAEPDDKIRRPRFKNSYVTIEAVRTQRQKRRVKKRRSSSTAAKESHGGTDGEISP